MNALKENEEISLIGFGKFYKLELKSRMGRNPKTGKEIKIATSTIPKFTPGIKLKLACNKKTSKKVKFYN